MTVKASWPTHVFLLVSASCIFVPASQGMDLSMGPTDALPVAWSMDSSTTGSTYGPPPGWSIGGNATNDYRFSTATAQGLTKIGQRRADIVSLHRPGASKTKFATLMQAISAEAYVDKRIHLSAELSTEDVSGRVALWMRVDDRNGKVLNRDVTESRAKTGTNSWKKYDVVLDVPPEGASIAFGFLLAGNGHVSAAEFTLEKEGDSVPTSSSVAPTTRPESLPTQPVNLKMSQL